MKDLLISRPPVAPPPERPFSGRFQFVLPTPDGGWTLSARRVLLDKDGKAL